MQCYDWSGLYYLYIFWSIWTGNDALSLRKRNGYWMAVLVKCGESVSCLVMFYFLQAYGQQPTRFLCPWDFPGKNAGVCCHYLLQGIFLTHRLNLGLLHYPVICITDSLPSELPQDGLEDVPWDYHLTITLVKVINNSYYDKQPQIS